MTPEVVALIEGGIRLDWSPEQVSGWLSAERALASAMGGFIYALWVPACLGRQKPRRRVVQAPSAQP